MKKVLRNITVLFNLPVGNDIDDLDTQKSANVVANGLREAGYQVEILGILKNEIDTIKNIQADLVFNLVEWAGRDYKLGVAVIEELEKVELPYTGSNPWGYEVSCNKLLMKKLLDKYQILTPRWKVFGDKTNLRFPVIVKPVYEHSAIGISQTSICQNEDGVRQKAKELVLQYDQPALIEEFIDGDEAQVTVLEKNGQPWVLPPAIFRYQKKPGYWPINTYAAKWDESHWESKMSDWTDDVNVSIQTAMQQLAEKCYLKLGGRSYPRMDMRINGDTVYVLEVNNNPGIDFDPDSGISVSAQKAGLDWPSLLKNIVEEAYNPFIV